MQCLVLIHGDAEGTIAPEEWGNFFEAAQASGFFKGGSELGSRKVLGNVEGASPSDHLAGFMRFDADDKDSLLDLLYSHPVVLHRGTIELCEMPES